MLFRSITIAVDADNILSTVTGANLEIQTLDAGGTVTFNRDMILAAGENFTVNNGVVDITGSLIVDDLTLDSNDIFSATNIIDFNSSLVPTTDANRNLGDGTNAWQNLYLDTAIISKTAVPGPITATFNAPDLMTLRSAAYRDLAKTTPAQDGDVLFWNNAAQAWLASHPDTEIMHEDLNGLDTGSGSTNPDAGHTQFLLLEGRAGGQVAHGGNATTQTLSLFDNDVDVNGVIIDADAIAPNSNGVYDLGKPAAQYDDLYMTGELIGSRVQNIANAGAMPGFAAADEGRLVWREDTEQLMINDGEAYITIGRKSYNVVHPLANFGTAAVPVAVTVTPTVSDSRNCIWQLCCETNNGEIMGVKISKPNANQVLIERDIELPAGNYRLIGIEA